MNRRDILKRALALKAAAIAPLCAAALHTPKPPVYDIICSRPAFDGSPGDHFAVSLIRLNQDGTHEVIATENVPVPSYIPHPGSFYGQGYYDHIATLLNTPSRAT